jgi:sucrose-phosphate synthase
VKYVVELARALAMMPGVYRVDLFTRQVSSPDVDWSYGEPTEMLTSGSNDGEGMGESAGAYIVRIPCGPRDKYLKKEALWPYLQEFVDGALTHILNMSKALGEQVGNGKPVLPYVIHGHYADAGDVSALLSGALNVPMVLTGHSLGRNKLEQLLKQGRMPKQEIDSTYKIMRRIEGEELALDASELVITSTRQEIDEQWGLYDGYDVKLEKVLRTRARRGLSCHGRFMPRMVVSIQNSAQVESVKYCSTYVKLGTWEKCSGRKRYEFMTRLNYISVMIVQISWQVIPPGMDFSNVEVQEDIDGDGDSKDDMIGLDGASPKARPPIWAEVSAKLQTLLQAYNNCLTLSLTSASLQLIITGHAVPNQSSQADDPGAFKA